tara:strand:- start:249 stop:542 length:294 start_codon:yes stop_codon:yes gene_type:complete
MKNQNTRASTNYITTAHTASAGDMLEIELIRKTVKTINAENKWSERNSNDLPRYRVKLQARGARTAAAIADGKHPRKYDQSLPLRHAERLDVYVYKV